MSEIPFLNSFAYQVIVNILLAMLLYRVVLMMGSKRNDVRNFGLLFLIPLMFAACTFNAAMIIGRCSVADSVWYKFTKEEMTVAHCEPIANAVKKTDEWHIEFDKNYDTYHECVVKGSNRPTIGEMVVNIWRKLSRQQKYDILATADKYNEDNFNKNKEEIKGMRTIVLDIKEKNK